MAIKRDGTAPAKVETIVGAGTKVVGKIIAEGTVRIDGSIEGDVEAQGDIIIGEKGLVEGELVARNAYIAGSLKGNVKSEGRLEATASARIIGDIEVKNLIIDEGAQFKGNCIMDLDESE